MLIEAVACSLADCLAAQEGGCKRVELVSAIELGGLTPSLGALQSAKAGCDLEIIAMIRPRTGGFCYSEPEMAAMERDVELFRDNGATGIAFGILDENREIDEIQFKRLLRRLPPSMQSVCHRAFDVTPDPFEALERLIDLGVTRLLTSGQKPTAPEGADLIRRLVESADGRIEILPGGGVRLDNMAELAASTGATQLHMTFFRDEPDRSMEGVPIEFNGRKAMEAGYRIVDPTLVREAIYAATSTDNPITR